MKLLSLIIVILNVFGCSSEETIRAVNAQSVSLESQKSTGKRFLCATDVNARDEFRNIIDDVKLNYGDIISMTGETREFVVGNENLKFNEVLVERIDRKVWLANIFLFENNCANNHTSTSNKATVSKKNFPSRVVPNGSVLNIVAESGLSAMMDTIAYAEFKGNPEAKNADAYHTMYGYGIFWSDAWHPRIVRCSGGLCSDAAGRYQILSNVWNDINRYVNTGQVDHIPQIKGRKLNDFGPANQDRAALVLFWYKFAYNDLKNLQYKDDYSLKIIVQKLAKTWASFPWSPYGQGNISWAPLRDYYWKRYKFYRDHYQY